LIAGRNTYCGTSTETLWGVFQHYDYLDTRSYQFGGQSLGVGMMRRMRADTAMPVILSTHLNPLVFGGSNVGVPNEGGREYNFATGANARLQAVVEHRKFGFVAFRCWLYWFHTISGLSGNELSSYVQTTVSARI
ncbi:MAG TPA: hypothetical protein PLQ13_13380, partial [Candidatus Krumholzibacteria bacterium]|nr:hypothetical protein [Candidatus Krumholzibacteria bacterium]